MGRFRLAALAVLSLLAATAGTRARAAPEADARSSALRMRVTEWCDWRKGLVSELCPRCKGFGGGRDAANRWVPCPRCQGRKTVLSPRVYRKVYYDVRTPAYRGRPDAERRANAEYTAADQAGKRPDLFLESFKMDHVVVDGAGGTAFVLEGPRATTPVEWHWIAVTDASKKEQWYLFTPEADGEWPPPGATAPPSGSGLDPDEEDALRRRVGLAAAKHEFAGASRADGILVVAVFDRKAPDETSLRADSAADLYAIAKAAFATLSAETSLRIDFLARWRDKFGTVEKLAYRRTSITRADFERVHPENLAPDELLALFHSEDRVCPDHVLWWKD